MTTLINVVQIIFPSQWSRETEGTGQMRRAWETYIIFMMIATQKNCRLTLTSQWIFLALSLFHFSFLWSVWDSLTFAVLLSLCWGITFAHRHAPGGLCCARSWTWVDCVKGKKAIHCANSLALFYFLKYGIYLHTTNIQPLSLSVESSLLSLISLRKYPQCSKRKHKTTD